MPNCIHILGKEASIKLGITLKFCRAVQILYMRNKNLNFINWICFYLGCLCKSLKPRDFHQSFNASCVAVVLHSRVPVSHWANVRVSIGLHSLPENSGEDFLYLFINRLLAKSKFPAVMGWEADSISWLVCQLSVLASRSCPRDPFPSSRPAIFLAFKFLFWDL